MNMGQLSPVGRGEAFLFVLLYNGVMAPHPLQLAERDLLQLADPAFFFLLNALLTEEE